jgi:hypothetical protein
MCGECYENVYTERRTNYPSFNTFKCKRFHNTRYINIWNCKALFETPCISYLSHLIMTSPVVSLHINVRDPLGLPRAIQEQGA